MHSSLVLQLSCAALNCTPLLNGGGSERSPALRDPVHQQSWVTQALRGCWRHFPQGQICAVYPASDATLILANSGTVAMWVTPQTVCVREAGLWAWPLPSLVTCCKVASLSQSQRGSRPCR
ncbi:general transcription factor II-I [Platysternon megacephalum]|uniref:General transcription factor II-I n=1 Tax=Platysternon megacephalum TaxID=55544 RepID=A0A4D9ESN6_9SAUR|nr:general transcription factor II-I [Platysternon megacephalum]